MPTKEQDFNFYIANVLSLFAVLFVPTSETREVVSFLEPETHSTLFFLLHIMIMFFESTN